MAIYFSLYDSFTNGEIIPFFEISKRSSDKYEIYVLGDTTYDSLSYKYYNNSLMGWVIKYANPQFPDEFDILDGESIRIPFPLSEVEKEILDKVETYKKI